MDARAATPVPLHLLVGERSRASPGAGPREVRAPSGTSSSSILLPEPFHQRLDDDRPIEVIQIVAEQGWDGSGLGLRDRLAVVIGASEGIGAAIAMGLSRAGATVILAGRSAERLRATADAARAEGQQAHVQTIDARDPEQLRALCAAVLREHGVPTILVNSMGGTLFKPAIDVEPEEWDAISETHLRGTFFACTSFAAVMADEGYGKIINLSSTFATAVVPGRSVYAAAKAGISQLTAALALEWAPAGIRVNAVAPGATRSPRVERWLADNPGLEERMVQGIPLGRIAETDDIVGPALFLASPMSDFVTGQTVLVDGGWAKSRQQAPVATLGDTGRSRHR